jgi:hypothetical protein
MVEKALTTLCTAVGAFVLGAVGTAAVLVATGQAEAGKDGVNSYYLRPKKKDEGTQQ